jgi:hypothetical protein
VQASFHSDSRQCRLLRIDHAFVYHLTYLSRLLDLSYARRWLHRRCAAWPTTYTPTRRRFPLPVSAGIAPKGTNVLGQVSWVTTGIKERDGQSL